jgi:nucleoid-associated protein YgaU
MGRTRVRRRRSFAVVTVVGSLLMTGPVSRAFVRQEPSRPVARHVYVVRAGDTVWSIASRFSTAGDPRELVDAIGRRNRIDAGAITPGQALVIPSIA